MSAKSLLWAIVREHKRIQAMVVFAVMLLMLTACSSQKESVQYENESRMIESPEDDSIYIREPNGFSELAWWSETYKGGFPKSRADYYSWESEPFADEVVQVVSGELKAHCEQKTVIAVLDSGFNISRVNREYLWYNEDEIPNDETDNDENGHIDDWCGVSIRSESEPCSEVDFVNSHGTCILNSYIGEFEGYKGLLCDANVRIMLIRVLDNEEHCSIEQLIDAIEYAEQNGATICSMSLTTGVYSEKLKKCIEQSNMLFVVPAGNDACELGDCLQYPAMFRLDNVITVGALRADGKLSNQSNYGKDFVDVAAPGSDIVVLNGKGQMLLRSGTSYAVPFVVAAAVVVNLNERGLSAVEIKSAILANVCRDEAVADLIKCGGYLKLRFH